MENKFKKEAEERLNKSFDEVFGKKIKLKDFREVVMKFDGDMLNNFLLLIQDDEEREFYVNLFDLVLQTKQKEVIKKGVF